MRKAIALGLLLSFAVCSSGRGQGEDLGAAAKGAFCSTVEDSLSRLVCFDKAFPKQSGMTPDRPSAGADDSLQGSDPLSVDTPSAAPATTWDVEVTKSPIDDSPGVFAMLMPSEVSGNGIGGGNAALVIRCSENTTSVILSTDMFMTEDLIPVTVRIGDAPATKSSWALSTTNKSVGLWSGADAIPFIRSLKDDTRLVVRIDERNRIDAQFELGKVSEVASQVAEACGWTRTPSTSPSRKPIAGPTELGIE